MREFRREYTNATLGFNFTGKWRLVREVNRGGNQFFRGVKKVARAIINFVMKRPEPPAEMASITLKDKMRLVESYLKLKYKYYSNRQDITPLCHREIVADVDNSIGNLLQALYDSQPVNPDNPSPLARLQAAEEVIKRILAMQDPQRSQERDDLLASLGDLDEKSADAKFRVVRGPTTRMSGVASPAAAVRQPSPGPVSASSPTSRSASGERKPQAAEPAKGGKFSKTVRKARAIPEQQPLVSRDEEQTTPRL